MAKVDDVRLTLPYIADDLPAPLPTQEQIENPNEVLAEVTGRKVVQVGEHYVVKYGTNNGKVEATTMIYLRNKTSINIPKVYAVYRSDANNALFIVVEFVSGDDLATLWPDLPLERKEQVCLDIKLQLDQVRSLPSLGYYGGIGHQLMPDGIFWIYERETPDVNGPFHSENELNNALAKKILLADEIWRGRGPQRAHFYQRMLSRALQDHAPVFTHADLQRKNIIVRYLSDETGEQSNFRYLKYMSL